MTAEVIAVTGAGGAIGGQLVARLVASGYEVVGLSRNPPRDTSDDIMWRQFSLSDSAETMSETFRGVDQLVHLAALIPGTTPVEQRDAAYWMDNVLGTQKLINAMSIAGVGRLILTSSANIYAPGQLEADENASIGPKSRILYLASKAAQEWLAVSMCQSARINCAVMRISSMIGDGRSIIDRLASDLAANKKIRIDDGAAFGSDFVDCDDVCDGLMLAIETKLSGICNLSSGERTELLDVVLELAKKLGKSPDAVATVHVDHAPDTGFPAINCNRLRSYGYNPKPLSQVLDRIAADALARSTAA